MPTTIVNVRVADPETYEYCGRPTIFGNPFRVGKDGTRIEVIAKYIDYFFDRIQRDRDFKKRVISLKGKRIGCWCSPELCHLHVIATYLDEFC